MDTKKRIKRTMVKSRLKRKYRKTRRQNKFAKKRTSSILPIILTILLAFNIGAFMYLINSGDISKDINIFDLILETLNIREISAQEPNSDPNLEFSPEDYAEFKKSKDEIIDFLEEYENLIVVEEGDSNIENVPDPINVDRFMVEKEKEYIFTYHTHTTESFLSKDGSYYNTDPNKNIVAIGETLSAVLTANGHKIKHDTTVHDLPSFNQSYSRSKNTIRKNLESNKNLKVILDIHRDGRDANDPNLEAFIKDARIDIDGVSVGTFSLVVGPDSENYERVLSFAKYIKAVSDVMYPGLCNGIIIKPVGKYNQYFSDYSALFEMGSNWVTIEETHETAKKVGEILSVVLDKLIIE